MARAGWLSGVLVLLLAAVAAASQPPGAEEQAPHAGEKRIEAQGSTPPAAAEPDGQAEEIESEQLSYSENRGWQDFEVHFFVSLPFTALYSYLALTSLDAAVQGRFPSEFRQADMWMVIGMAAGSSLAIALGSLDRVPDQSQDVLPGQAAPVSRPATLAAVEIRF
ncbi:MAG: hypothetical protein AB1439_02460 [candidate division FCPU426 bacterium]